MLISPVSIVITSLGKERANLSDFSLLPFFFYAVHHACQEANKKVFNNIDLKSSEVYRLANQFRRENADVVGDKPVKNDAGEMSMSEDSKQKA